MPEESVASRLRQTMKKHDLNCAELARRAGVRTSFLYDILSGKSANPSAVQLSKVAAALGVSLSYLAGSGGLHSIYPAASERDTGYIAIPRIILDKTSGKIIAAPDRKPDMQLRGEWLLQQFGLAANDARLFCMEGDEMSPTLRPQDVLLINTKNTTPTPPGIFLIFDGVGLSVRRLEYKGRPANNRLRVIADNNHYLPDERKAGDVLVVGRVIWFSRAV